MCVFNIFIIFTDNTSSLIGGFYDWYNFFAFLINRVRLIFFFWLPILVHKKNRPKNNFCIFIFTRFYFLKLLHVYKEINSAIDFLPRSLCSGILESIYSYMFSMAAQYYHVFLKNKLSINLYYRGSRNIAYCNRHVSEQHELQPLHFYDKH